MARTKAGFHAMIEFMMDEPGMDTTLARKLHKEQRLSVEILQTVLQYTRTGRGDAGQTLARVLVERGLLSPDEAKDYLAQVQTERDRRPGSGPPPAGSGGSGAYTVPPNAGLTGSGGSGAYSVGAEGAARGFPEGIPPELAASGEVAGQVMRGGARAWAKGETIGAYRLVERLGAGAMGVVWLAEHQRTRAAFAIKTLPEILDPDFVRRFARECKVQAGLPAHPHVVQVVEHGMDGPRPYLVAEYLPGGDLRERLRMGALSAEEAARVAAGLADGLAHLHAAEILHRDLKPGNVLFSQEGVPKWVDFGLARFQGAQTLTKTGDTLGTPAYMAPEQVMGERSEVGTWSDVYGLGALLYHMLTGQAPFSGASAVEVMSRVALEEPTAPHSLNSELPVPLSKLCLRALHKDPGARPSAQELARSLRVWSASSQETAPVGARPSGALFFGAGVGLGLVLGLAVGLVAGLGLKRFGDDGGSSDPNRPPTETAAITTRVADPAPAPEPTSAPEPAVEVGALVWSWTANQRRPLTLTTTGRWGGLAWDCRYGFSLEAVAVEARAVTLEVTWTALAIERTFGSGASAMQISSYDSARADSSSPYHGVLGSAFQIRIDPLSGRVQEVTGFDSIVVGLAERAGRSRGNDLPWFDSTDRTRETFNRIFYILPGREQVTLEPWRRTLQSPLGGVMDLSGWTMGSDFYGTRGPDGYRIVWRAAASEPLPEAMQTDEFWQGMSRMGIARPRGEVTRRAEGSALVCGGWLTQFRYTEDWGDFGLQFTFEVEP